MNKKVIVISTSLRENSNSAALAEDDDNVPAKSVSGLRGWTDCFEKAAVKCVLFCGGVNAPGDIKGNAKLKEAYEMGKNV